MAMSEMALGWASLARMDLAQGNPRSSLGVVCVRTLRALRTSEAWFARESPDMSDLCRHSAHRRVLFHHI